MSETVDPGVAFRAVAIVDDSGVFCRQMLLLDHEQPEYGAHFGDGEVCVDDLPPEPRVLRAWAWRDHRWLRRAALLDANNIYMGIEEVEPGAMTDRHLPQLFECDNAPKRYRWIADSASALGGSLHPIGRVTPEQKFTDTEPLPPLALMFIRLWATRLIEVPVETLAWLDWYTRSVDFKSYWNNPEVYSFMHRNDVVEVAPVFKSADEDRGEKP